MLLAQSLPGNRSASNELLATSDQKLEAIRSPKGGWDRDRADWLGDFGLDAFDLDAVNARRARRR